MAKQLTPFIDQGLSMIPSNFRRQFEAPLNMLNTELDRVWSNVGSEGRRTGIFPVDIQEENDQLVVEAELPGFTRDQIDVNIDRNVLSIVADRSTEKTEKSGDSESSNEVVEPKSKKYISERSQARVARRFELPYPIDAEKVSAKYTDGVLTLHLPKQESAKARKIDVS